MVNLVVARVYTLRSADASTPDYDFRKLQKLCYHDVGPGSIVAYKKVIVIEDPDSFWLHFLERGPVVSFERLEGAPRSGIVDVLTAWMGG